MLVWWKCFVPHLYQFRRGISGGPALKYFYMIHRGGRLFIYPIWEIYLFIKTFVQPIAFGVSCHVMSCHLNFESQAHESLFNGTWQKRPREDRLRFEIEVVVLQLQQAVYAVCIHSADMRWLRLVGSIKL